MAINEACQIWIEQRAAEELTEREKTGKSLRSIGKEIAAEILKVFEAKVNPSTIFQRVRRAAERADTNVSHDPTIESDKEIQNNKQNDETITKNGTLRKRKKGGGRKPKSKPKENLDEQRLQQAYEVFLKEVVAANTNKWKTIQKSTVMHMIENLLVLMEGENA